MKGLIGHLIQRILAYKPTAKYLAACGMELATHAFTLKARGMTPKAHAFRLKRCAMKSKAHRFCQNGHRFMLKQCAINAEAHHMEFKEDDFLTK